MAMELKKFGPIGAKLVGGAFACLALLALGVWSIATALSSSSSAQSPAPPEVDVAQVVYKDIARSQTYSGRLEAVEHVEVRPRVSGVIVAIHFKDAQLVKKGDLLFTIDQRPYLADAERAEAQSAVAQARSNYTTADALRARSLVSEDAISKRDYDLATSAAKEAGASWRAARASVRTAQVNLAYTKIVAPVSGRVSRAEVTVGNVVNAGPTAPALTTLVSVSPIYASFDVDEQTYLSFLAQARTLGATVGLSLANEVGFEREGVLDSIDNQMDTRTGTIRVRAKFENADGFLLPGMYARVIVREPTQRPAILVSDSAVSTDQDKNFVLIVGQKGKTEYREVRTGAVQGGLRVIEEGLSPGEKIVVSGLQRAQPGSIVSPNRVAMEKTARIAP